MKRKKKKESDWKKELSREVSTEDLEAFIENLLREAIGSSFYVGYATYTDEIKERLKRLHKKYGIKE